MSKEIDVQPGGPRTVACPQCGRPAPLTRDNRWRPFCGERCKMVDLGAWFSEAHAIAAVDPEDRFLEGS